MPVRVSTRGGRKRIVEAKTGKIAVGRSGHPIDGGGHGSMADAKAQAAAINTHIVKAAKKKGK